MNFVGWLDQSATDAVDRLRRPWLNPLLIAITDLGDHIFLTAVVLAAVVALWMRRRPRTAVIVAVMALAGFPLSEGFKSLVRRPRPQGRSLIDLPSSWSFPSGHALESTAVYGVLALTVGRRLRRRRQCATVAVLGAALPLLVGFSRVYLGVHYLTDVLAGWAAGLALHCWPAGWIGGGADPAIALPRNRATE